MCFLDQKEQCLLCEGMGMVGNVYLGAIERHNSVEAVELDEQGVRVPLHMCVVLRQQLQQQLYLILHVATVSHSDMYYPSCVISLIAITAAKKFVEFEGSCDALLAELQTSSFCIDSRLGLDMLNDMYLMTWSVTFSAAVVKAGI